MTLQSPSHIGYSPPPIGWTGWRPAGAVHWVLRLVLVAAGGGLIALLATAATLTPSRRGLGTHQQLGLPPCTLVSWYGVRCPSCGMTTAWAHLTHGQVAAAFGANAGGALLALAAAACGPWLVVSGLMGRWLVGPPSELAVLALSLTIMGVTLVDWTVRLSLGW